MKLLLLLLLDNKGEFRVLGFEEHLWRRNSSAWAVSDIFHTRFIIQVLTVEQLHIVFFNLGF